MTVVVGTAAKRMRVASRISSRTSLASRTARTGKASATPRPSHLRRDRRPSSLLPPSEPLVPSVFRPRPRFPAETHPWLRQPRMQARWFPPPRAPAALAPARSSVSLMATPTLRRIRPSDHGLAPGSRSCEAGGFLFPTIFALFEPRNRPPYLDNRP